MCTARAKKSTENMVSAHTHNWNNVKPILSFSRDLRHTLDVLLTNTKEEYNETQEEVEKEKMKPQYTWKPSVSHI